MKDRGRNEERARSSQRARNYERERIAHLAARIMAEDGIEDYGLAKRKAARQAGIADTRQLPGNDEIEAALRAYQQIYHADEQRERLRELRRRALRAMRELGEFEPYLTGSVLSGAAGKYADINLQLFTDNAKAVEMFLIERRIQYRSGTSTLYAGDERLCTPLFVLEDDGVEVSIVVLTPRELRVPLATSPGGKTIERARTSAVEELLAVT